MSLGFYNSRDDEKKNYPQAHNAQKCTKCRRTVCELDVCGKKHLSMLKPRVKRPQNTGYLLLKCILYRKISSLQATLVNTFQERQRDAK